MPMPYSSLLTYAATLALLLAVRITARVISRDWALHNPTGEKSLLARVALLQTFRQLHPVLLTPCAFLYP